MEALSDSSAFAWGAVGGFVALTVTQGLPIAVSAVRTGTGPKLTRWRVVGAVIIVLVFILAGGVAAAIMDDATKGSQALVYGMAWEAILGGALRTGAAALPGSGGGGGGGGGGGDGPVVGP